MEEASILKLIMEKGPREGETLEFSSGSVIRIGRVVRGNTLAIKDAGISTKHLYIEFKFESGKWVISDLDSSNGTILNGANLPPNVPDVLSDGDTIKIGEFTAIKVKIGNNGENRVRRNPKRGTAGARVGESGECNELGLGFGGELVNNADVAVEKPKRRGRPPRKAAVVVKVEEIENVGPTAPKQRRQVSSRRTRSSNKEENPNFNSILGENPNVGPKQRRQVSSRRTRSSKKDENPNFNSILGENPTFNSILGENPNVGPIVNEPLVKVENEVLEEEEVVEGLNLGRIGSKECESISGVEENLPNGPSESVPLDVLEDKEVVQGSNLGQETKDSGIDGGEGPELEKMTLGDWFDYLEVYLPKQIYVETEELILGMKHRAEQFHEFMLQQKNAKEKGKRPMG